MPKTIASEARTWINTPWQHNQACKGVGVDCARFYHAVLEEATGLDWPLRNYSRRATEDSLLGQIRAVPNLIELDDIIGREEGDLLVFLVGRFPGHVGICNGHGMIHADNAIGKVVEIPDLGTAWRKRLCNVFRVIP